MFSPDGRKLFVIGQQLRGELERFDARTGEFVTYLGGISASFVDFSRDGQWVTYVAYPEGTLWRSRLDGSERLQLTFAPMEAMVPKWSPDGSRILFYGIGTGKEQRAYWISASGGEAKPVSAGRGEEMNTCWSPDGDSVMYSDFPFFAKEPGKVAIHVLNLKTQNVESLPGSAGFFAPSWSPDGRYVGAVASDGQRIMLFDFKSRAWTEPGAWFGADEVVARWAVFVLPALWTRVCRHAGASKRPPSGRSGGLERNSPGRAAGGAGVRLDAGWCSDRAAGRRNAGDLFAGLVRAIIAPARRVQGHRPQWRV